MSQKVFYKSKKTAYTPHSEQHYKISEIPFNVDYTEWLWTVTDKLYCPPATIRPATAVFLLPLRIILYVILIGHPGVGKTWLGKCIGYTATQTGIKVLFTTAMDMINQLIAAEADHSLVKKLSYYQSPALLIIDEIGYLPLGSHGSNLFFQVISSRHQVKSTLITTNLPFSEWGKIFDSTTAATAIADRLVHHSEILVLEGPSYRKKERKN